VQRGRPLVFPRDHGAHPETRLEWWYLTGWLAATGSNAPTHGFQVTFFRSRTAFGAAADGAADSAGVSPGRFAPRHLLLAHAAVTDLGAGRHHHAQRIGRWNGEAASGPDRAALHDADVRLAGWQLARRDIGSAEPGGSGALWTTQVRADGFALAGTLRATQPLLLQGDAGFSRKGPEERQASHYYSWPQLSAELTLELQGKRFAAAGRGWLDQEWSDEVMHPLAVGWDWIGINLADGSALTAFRLRRADGSALWAGGSHRARAAAAVGGFATRVFEPHEVQFEPGRRWRSPATQASYPMQWQVQTPAGRYGVRALLDAQELASRPGSGAVYWEGLAELLDTDGRRVGIGYLEMTGYAAPLKLA
jgi:predicted secreted hydrolase